MASAVEPASLRGWTLFHSGVASSQRRWAGIAIHVDTQLGACTFDCTQLSERVAFLRLWPKQQFSVSTLFGVLREYPPFFKVLGSAPPGDYLVFLGDFNAHVVIDREIWRGVVGKNDPPGLTPSCVLLLDFCACHGLSITNTIFRHKGVHM